MLKIERHRIIEKELSINGSIIISDLSKKIGCSEETIRRDLKEMESKNLLKRIHGGAYLPEKDDKGVPIQLREMYIPKIKENLSKYVVSNLISDNDTIMLDCSTTCLSLAKAILASDFKVTIITNSLRIMSLFDEKPRTSTMIAIGGNYRKRSCSFVGHQAVEALSNYVSDKSFISCSALSLNHGLLDNNQSEGQIRKIMQQQSKSHYLLIDHTKFDDNADYIISPLSSVEEIITDTTPTEEWLEKIEREKIKLTLSN